VMTNPERNASITDGATRRPKYPCASWLQRIKWGSMKVLMPFATSHLCEAGFKQLPVTTVEVNGQSLSRRRDPVFKEPCSAKKACIPHK